MMKQFVLVAALICLVGCNPAPKAEDIADLGFILKDPDGKDVRLSDYRGRPLIVNFWFTNCPPCRQETPVFIKLVEKYKDKGFTVLGISVSDTPEQIKAFAAEYHAVAVHLRHRRVEPDLDTELLQRASRVFR